MISWETPAEFLLRMQYEEQIKRNEDNETKEEK